MSCSGRGRRKRRSLAAELSVLRTWVVELTSSVDTQNRPLIDTSKPAIS
jgi:hypothetical protein